MNAAAMVGTLGVATAMLTGMVHIPAGDYLPLRGMADGMRMPVAAFDMDVHAVTRGDYLMFVRAHPEWKRGSVNTKFVDASYLPDGSGALNSGSATDLMRPVTSVSQDRTFMRRLLEMDALRPSTAPLPVGRGFRNIYGIEGLHGGASEWTEDFRPAPMKNCAGAALGVSDATNYPALLREAFRSALSERSTTRTLGFRCAT